MRRGLTLQDLVIPHQALVEFYYVTTRPRSDLKGASLLKRSEAYNVMEDLLQHYPILYPDRAVVRTALLAAGALGLSWLDAHLWAYAEVNGLDEILTEDFEHGRRYGTVRAKNPFLIAADSVHELPALYEA